MTNRKLQQVAESDYPPAHARVGQQHRDSTDTLRWAALLALAGLGTLLLGAIIMGVMSISDALHGHQGETWQHFTQWLQAYGWLLIALPVGTQLLVKGAIPFAQIWVHTSRDRAEASRIRAQTRAANMVINHNKRNLPPQGYINMADELGNYAQIVDAGSGRLRDYVLAGNSPVGNAGINPKQALDFMDKLATRHVAEIEGPSSSAVDVKALHIPTFRESLDAGLIGPGQKELLICHELVIDEATGAVTGELIPYHGGHAENSTNFLGGSSKSGKTTYMANVGAQGALMNALYYIIDPHLMQAEKSVAQKMAALSHAFILPPAMTDIDVATVLAHAREEAMARVNGVETRYTGRPIVFIVDEALALMSRAQRTGNKEILALYRELAFFMRDLGTQYNKFDINGIFASQYITKDAFKLPGGNIDFRDGCQNQTLLRLPPNQAQAMRLIDKKDLPGIRLLPPGHGFMGFACGDIIRMASGNVTRQDIEYVAQLTAPSPSRKTQYTVPGTGHGRASSGTRRDMLVEPMGHEFRDAHRTLYDDDVAAFQEGRALSAGRPQNTVSAVVESVPPCPAFVPQGDDKLVPDALHDELAHWYPIAKSVRGALQKVGITNNRYTRHASYLLEQRGLKARKG
jgi:hypothetical protein